MAPPGLIKAFRGGSYIFHHTLTMFARQGFRADPVELQVSFGKDKTFWTNVFPTQLLLCHASEVKRLVTILKILRWFEVYSLSYLYVWSLNYSSSLRSLPMRLLFQ
jgi:hypothetical protein